jgi:hypothetical protein
MIRQDILPYVQTYMKQGYNKTVIVRYLSAYGYSPTDIADTYDSIAPRKKIPRLVPIAAGLVIFVAIIGVVLYVLLLPAQPKLVFVASLDVEGCRVE